MRRERTNLGGVIGGPKDELRCTVVPRTNVRHIRFVFHKDLGASKITELQYARGGVEQQVLRLDVPMADALRVDVGERPEELIGVQLSLEDGHDRLHLVEVA